MRGTAKTYITNIFMAGALATALIFQAGCESPDHPDSTAESAISEVTEHRARGIVQSIDVDRNSVVVDHEPVETLGWPAMRMNFIVQDAEVLEQISEGQHIQFAFRLVPGSEESYVITGVHAAY